MIYWYFIQWYIDILSNDWLTFYPMLYWHLFTDLLVFYPMIYWHFCARAAGPGAFYSQTGVLSDPSVRVCVRPPKSGDSPNSISIGFTAPSGGIISRVDFRNPKKIKENREKPNEGRIGRDPVLGPFLRPFLKIKITQCVTATKIWLLEIATVYEGKTAKWRPILELQRGPGATLALRVLSTL